MYKAFTLDEFLRFASDDLRLATQTYIKPGALQSKNVLTPAKSTIKKILNYSNVLEVVRLNEKKHFNVIIN